MKLPGVPAGSGEQLWGAVGAVFGSWNNDRAIVYRRKYDIPHEWGTAVNVQTMVFGNLGDTSATGVAFTRDPATGEKVFYGEYLINAQGEDVVAGTRTPQPIAKLKEEMPKAHAELVTVRKTLESRFKDMQDFEFTVEDNKLYMLQTRNGKRTGPRRRAHRRRDGRGEADRLEGSGGPRAGRFIDAGARADL